MPPSIFPVGHCTISVNTCIGDKDAAEGFMMIAQFPYPVSSR
jgi:hypothetical protein